MERNASDRRSITAVTLVELLIVISLIGILGGIAIVQMGGMVADVKLEVGTDQMNELNRAVLHYNQAASTINVPPQVGTDDELAVLALLKTRDLAVPGSPLIAAAFPEAASSHNAIYRLRWNGKFFELLVPGVAGSGIVIAE